MGLGDERRGHGDKPGPHTTVVSATRKVGVLGPRLEEEVKPSICIHILLKFHHKADIRIPEASSIYFEFLLFIFL